MTEFRKVKDTPFSYFYNQDLKMPSLYTLWSAIASKMKSKAIYAYNNGAKTNQLCDIYASAVFEAFGYEMPKGIDWEKGASNIRENTHTGYVEIIRTSMTKERNVVSKKISAWCKDQHERKRIMHIAYTINSLYIETEALIEMVEKDMKQVASATGSLFDSMTFEQFKQKNKI